MIAPMTDFGKSRRRIRMEYGHRQSGASRMFSPPVRDAEAGLGARHDAVSALGRRRYL